MQDVDYLSIIYQLDSERCDSLFSVGSLLVTPLDQFSHPFIRLVAVSALVPV